MTSSQLQSTIAEFLNKKYENYVDLAYQDLVCIYQQVANKSLKIKTSKKAKCHSNSTEIINSGMTEVSCNYKKNSFRRHGAD